VVVIVGGASPVAPTPTAGGATPVPSTPPSPSPPPAPPAVDQIVSANRAGGSPQIAAPLFATTQGNELVLALVSAHGPAGSVQAVSAVSGGGLTWSRAAVANTVEGTAEVWQAYAASAVAPSTIAATLSAGGYEGSITIVGFRGAAHAVAASATGGASSGAPGVKLITAAAGSLVWAVGHDADRAASIEVMPGQTLVNEFVDTSAGATSWVQATAQIPAAGTQVLVGAHAPVNDRWDLAAVEIAPGG